MFFIVLFKIAKSKKWKLKFQHSRVIIKLYYSVSKNITTV